MEVLVIFCFFLKALVSIFHVLWFFILMMRSITSNGRNVLPIVTTGGHHRVLFFVPAVR